MNRHTLAHAGAGILLLAFALLLTSALVATSVAHAQSAADGAQVSAKKKCKITQKRNSKGRCVTKKCKKGYKLGSKTGKCKRIKCKKGYKLSSKSGKCLRLTSKDRSDVDGDGLPLWREQDFKTNPLRKSILLQMNFPNAGLRAALSCGQLDAIVAGFAAAPVLNPNGSTGIDLHIDAGRNCPSRSYDMGGSKLYKPVSSASCPGANDGMTTGAEVTESRMHAFHIAAMQPTCGNGGVGGGLADLPGQKMVVYTDGEGFAMPLMHELGHNLGLDHGPQGPNRRSVMAVRIWDSTNNSSASVYEVIDFQRIPLPALDENALVESDGIGLPVGMRKQWVSWRCPDGSPQNQWTGESDGWVDWDCGWSGFPLDPYDIDLAPVSVDINGDGQKTVIESSPTEWDKLTYTAGGLISPLK